MKAYDRHIDHRLDIYTFEFGLYIKMNAKSLVGCQGPGSGLSSGWTVKRIGSRLKPEKYQNEQYIPLEEPQKKFIH